MVSAQETLAKHAEDVDAGDAVLPLLSNADGAVVSSADDVLSRLVNQVTNPVRWDSCMSALGERGVDAVVEFPPAGALTGMVRRALKGVQTIALKTPADLDKVADQLGSAA